MTRRNTGILHSINPEIDRTYHRLVRQNRTLDTNFVSDYEHHVAENTASEHFVSVHSEYSDSVHSVAFPNFDHSVHSENMAQPPTPPGPSRQDKLETKIDSLTTLITQLSINQQKSSTARVCGICTSSDHYSDMCPSLLEPRTGGHLEAYAANIYNNRPPHQQQHYDPPSSSTYNPGWRNQAPFQNNNVGIGEADDMQNMQFHQETRASIQRQESSLQNLTTQMGKMATSLNTLQSQNSDKLPSQTVLKPRNVSAITLRSGKQTEVPTPRTDFVLHKEHDASKMNKYVLEENENTTRETHANQPSSSAAQQPFSIPLPFPPKIISTKKMGNMEELDKDLLDTFRKVEVNIPLLDAIK
ncbi:hypothetical protein Lal_00039372 [Lupinus albus]|nr:hypothetical protein Lal_00039372 [Lupinus albus]